MTHVDFRWTYRERPVPVRTVTSCLTCDRVIGEAEGNSVSLPSLAHSGHEVAALGYDAAGLYVGRCDIRVARGSGGATRLTTRTAG